MRKILDKIWMSGAEVWPIIEGGKGIGVSNGYTAGAFAAAGAIGTFSGVQADFIDDNGQHVPIKFETKTRLSRHEELVKYSIKGAISQARIAFDKSRGKGRIHMNVLWEVGGAMRIIHGVLAGAKGLVNGITCGAGMPYKLAELAEQYKVYYYPIISSARVFKILWQRAYHKHADFLGGVVYEDPWLAGGHNGLSNKDSPDMPQDPFERTVEIRTAMNAAGLESVPIIMAGGVWALKDWSHFINSTKIGKIAFQFGTRPILTQESTVPDGWKNTLLKIKHGDVALNNFSPTGFYSSAVQNGFLRNLQERSFRQIPFLATPSDTHVAELSFGGSAISSGRSIYVTPEDKVRAEAWMEAGWAKMMKTPDQTIIFVTQDEFNTIREDQIACKGCLSQCRFSNWKQDDGNTTGLLPDPRSFCIQKTLDRVVHGGDVENELLFSGYNTYKFASDPFYADGHIPTVQQLVDRILTGE